MNIKQIEWCSYTTIPSYMGEIEFLQWQSDPEGKFLKNNVNALFRSIIYGYSKVLMNKHCIDFDTAVKCMCDENQVRFENKLKQVFENMPFMCGISYSKLEEILSVINVPVF